MSKGGHYLAQKPQKPRKQTKTWVIVVAVILAVVLGMALPARAAD